MFTKVLSTTIAASFLLSVAVTNPAFAGGGGGDGGESGIFATLHNPDGSSITSRKHKNGDRVVTKRDKRGKVTKRKRIRKAKKRVRRPRAKQRPWASAYDPDTGTRTTAIGNGDGTRTVITVGPFGISIGLSN